MTERPTIRVTTIECETYVNIDDVLQFIKTTVEGFVACAPKPNPSDPYEVKLHELATTMTKATAKGLCSKLISATREYEESNQP